MCPQSDHDYESYSNAKIVLLFCIHCIFQFDVLLHVKMFWHLSLCCRPLWVEYPQDPATFAIDDEFLIGETQNIKTPMCFVPRDLLMIFR